MSALSPLWSALRALGTVAVFAITGPVAIALASAAAVAALGAPLLELFTALTGLTISRNWMVISFMLFVFFLATASFLPSLCTGIVFAILAFGFERGTISAAWVAALIVVLGFAMAGLVIAPPESSPLTVVPVKGVSQSLSLAAFLFVPAALASSLAWLLSRPLHRAKSVA